jgi:hypothetical protein
MPIKDLSEDEKAVVLQCLRAIAESELIDDWEMQTRLGVTRKTLREVISSWPNIDDTAVDSAESLAINNCMNEICHGVRVPPDEWKQWFTVTKAQILNAYRKWARHRGYRSTGIR